MPYFLLSQAGILLLQSVILGRLTEYFSIEEPTESDTRNAYIFALGNNYNITVNTTDSESN